ncbi:hypothetical protein OHA38_43295 (plasmid) [Streptomyces sp. NBC_01732]|uniref:hypothetical protein n=1 Tax=Streptomyces sp. NBC_01732 TaxID=2975926 RepID=UPI00352E5C16|nr:hypothetical protein OHA38_43295 [Streptomyces sp. NBC_01732]
MIDYLDEILTELDEPRSLPDPWMRLAALRRTVYETAIDGVAERNRQVRVTTYALANDDASLKRQRDELMAHVKGMGWQSTSQHFGETLSITGAQPALTSAFQYVGCGFADGILVPGRNSIRCSHLGYEKMLYWLQNRYTFIAFLPMLRHRTAGRV